jgi:hypothetical protein
LPPGFKSKFHPCWDELDAMKQAYVIGFHQTAEHERFEMAKATMPRLR